jgi:hypothetical protein
MGLDFSHSEAHWSYGGFHNFRTKLADEISFDLNDMQGFGGCKSWDDIQDDIIPLLLHSDCDGELSPDDCAKVYPRLLELVSKWNEDDWDKKKAVMLADGLKLCAECNEPMVFC